MTAKIHTINSLNEASFEEQVAVLTFLYESLFTEEPQDESKFKEILQPEFYPIIVKHAEDPEKSDKQKFVKLLGRAATNSTTETRAALMKAGAVSIFMSCLLSKDEEMITEGLNYLMAMAVDQVHAKYMMVNGIIMLIINILTDLPDVKLVSLTLDALITLSKATKQDGESRYITPIIPFFPNLMDEYENDDDVFIRLFEICNVLANKHVNDMSLIYALKDTGVVKLFFALLDHKNEEVRKDAVEFFLAVSTMQREDFIEEVLKSPIVEYFTNYFKETRPGLEKKFCKAVKNIMTYSRKGRKSVFDSNTIPKMIIDYINHTGNYKLQYEAVQTLYTMTAGATKPEIQHLVEEGCISAFCNLLTSRESVVLDHALVGLNNILPHSNTQNKYVAELQNCNGVDLLLEITESKGVFATSADTCNRILKQYFPEVTAIVKDNNLDNVEDLVPKVDEEKGVFRFDQEITVNGNFRF